MGTTQNGGFPFGFLKPEQGLGKHVAHVGLLQPKKRVGAGLCANTKTAFVWSHCLSSNLTHNLSGKQNV